MARTILAPSKINLGLHVLRMREDGFRDIDTVFLRIPWCDEVSWQPAPTRGMTCSDPDLPTDGRNLCLAAAERLADAMDVDSGFVLHLEKLVPYGAGLGSGSSDAAATLKLLGEQWGAEEGLLIELAAELGSDVPFFLGPPVARGTGRGERLEPMSWRCPYPLVVAVPPVHVPTAGAYGMVEPDDVARPNLVSLVTTGDTHRWRSELRNDFQVPVAAAWGRIGSILQALRDRDVLYAAMSGSGSAVFAACRTEDQAAELADLLILAGCRTWSGFAGDPV